MLRFALERDMSGTAPANRLSGNACVAPANRLSGNACVAPATAHGSAVPRADGTPALPADRRAAFGSSAQKTAPEGV